MHIKLELLSNITLERYSSSTVHIGFKTNNETHKVSSWQDAIRPFGIYLAHASDRCYISVGKFEATYLYKDIVSFEVATKQQIVDFIYKVLCDFVALEEKDKKYTEAFNKEEFTLKGRTETL